MQLCLKPCGLWIWSVSNSLSPLSSCMCQGILSDDSVLAAALWRIFFNRQCEDPKQLELMVEYVRKQMQYIDALDEEDLLLTGEVKWRPLVEENAQSILKVVTPTYNDAGL
ncbi:ubiquinol-cytochrome-c reductase complex assembly factor 1 [Lates japonicus]|uniref:Ubiquinol-cytochrome-c reductase complex assembly factor 1 n=1 Tax=Lates japonicus TaxID=270547 RepID=A0AAD3RFY2_LATJO|nr:ubiquinol-cytochrome-c reductase complex assembly factor 1 [Lates japonicus]